MLDFPLKMTKEEASLTHTTHHMSGEAWNNVTMATATEKNYMKKCSSNQSTMKTMLTNLFHYFQQLFIHLPAAVNTTGRQSNFHLCTLTYDFAQNQLIPD